jgi:hypothetical protein
MACDLWVRGRAWTGSSDIDVDALWRANHVGSIPPITYLGPAGNGTAIYNDGLGGTFSGTGWYGAPSYYLKCSGIEANQPCDCLNGGCIPASTYSTPGKYASLAACQSACAKDSNCAGECISSSEIAALKQAADNAISKMCG